MLSTKRTAMFKTVLFPIDQSRESREAVPTVAHVVKTYGSRLILLSVVSTDDSDSSTDGSTDGSTVAAAAAEAHQNTAQLLADAAALFQQEGIASESLEREGKPAFIICDIADEMAADLIIMGCRGLGLTEEGVSESVTNRVINLSPCPVMVVP
jgi:nucleotide-binding universal stress UspA family protein